MKQLAFLLAVFASIFAFSPAALAQSGGNQGIGDIFEDIFGNRRGQYPGQYPNPSQTLIDNIPVEIRFDPGQQNLPEESLLVVTAYGSPAPNVRRSRPLMLGETKLLMTGLGSPLNLVIAAPGNVTRQIDYARIEAKIVDFNGAVIWEARNSGEYRGLEAPIMTLDRVGSAASPTQPSTGSGNIGFENVRGSVDIQGAAPSFRGSTLVVRLVEEGLAGGSQTIAGEKRISIDGRSAPFNFEFDRPLMPGRQNIPLVFEAWIEDWAGRKTHTLPNAMPYNGSTTSYKLPLSENRNAGYAPTQTQGVKLSQGLARFNAFKGLPKGSKLIIQLERPVTGSRPHLIKEVQIDLDNKRGDIPFDLGLSATTFDPSLPTPVLRARVEDNTGQIYFSNPGGTQWQQGASTVELMASPNY